MKRILIFATAYYPFVGGAEVAVKEITDRIPEAEFDLLTLRFDSVQPRQERIGNVNVYRLGWSRPAPSPADLLRWPLKPNKYLFPFLACAAALRLHKQKPYETAWAIMAAYAGFGALFFKLLKPQVRYVLTLQEGDPIPEILRKVGWLKPLFRAIFTKADAVQAISNYLGRWARDMGFAGEPRIVPNAVDYAFFSREIPQPDLDALKSSLGKRSGDIFLLTTSRLVRKNAASDVIRALPYLPENYFFLVLGDGPEETELRRLAETEGADKRVKFLGFIAKKDLPAYLKISDVFVRPSLSEGFGNSFVEAMAAGLPVVATPVGGIVDFLFDPAEGLDKATGKFCRPHDPESIAEAVRWFREHPEETRKITENARQMVREKYDWQIVAGEMGKILVKDGRTLGR